MNLPLALATRPRRTKATAADRARSEKAFPGQGRLLGLGPRHGAGGRRRVLRCREGRDARHRRRVRLRQIDDRAAAVASDRAGCRRDRSSTATAVGAADGISRARIAPADADGVPGQLFVARTRAPPIADIIAFGPRTANRVPGKQALARAEQLLEQVGLEPSLFARRYPHEISGGQRQRDQHRPRSGAGAAPIDPRRGGLRARQIGRGADPQPAGRSARRDLGLTYLFISHDLNVVRHVSDRVVVMYLGRIVEIWRCRGDLPPSARTPTPRRCCGRCRAWTRDRRTEVSPLSGDPPNPINPPSGCRFRTRCAFAEEVCAGSRPALPIPSDGHQVACHMMVAGSGHSRTDGASAAG